MVGCLPSKAALVNTYHYLPHLFHSKDAKESAMEIFERRAADVGGR